MNDQRFFGKYRGTCLNNLDPELKARIQVMVPAVSGVSPTSWAMPCLPVGGMQMGVVTVPPPGAGVWVEFEGGDPDFPIWTGCYWGTGAEVPALSKMAPPAVPAIALQTTGQNGILISDLPGPTGGIMIKSASGAMITVSATGILIQAAPGGASISLIGPAVNINNGALTVI